VTWEKFSAGAARVGGIITAIIAVGGFSTFMLNNRVIRNYLKEAVDVPVMMGQIGELDRGQNEIKEEVQTLNESLQELTSTLETVQGVGELSTAPVIKFLQGSSLTDGRIGATVRFYVRFIKMRECGTGELSVWFRNGSKSIHGFEAVSIINEQGKTIRTSPGNPGEVLEGNWTARIPTNQGVTAGRGEAWLEISYPECPLVPTETSPSMFFEILDDDGRPIEREKE
jgi:hypothetical protein